MSLLEYASQLSSIGSFVVLSALSIRNIYRYFKQKQKKIIISIEGNIGAGKSTFNRKLEEIGLVSKYGIRIPEPVAKWQSIIDKLDGSNILGKFYKDNKMWAGRFQTITYITRMEGVARALRMKKKYVIQDRSTSSDKNVFAKMLTKSGDMSQFEYDWYAEWNKFDDEYVTKGIPHVYIYLRCDPTVAHQRITRRSRKEEEIIPLAYLQALHNQHEEWMAEEVRKGTHVLTVNCNVDFEHEPVEWQKMKIQIESFLKSL